jgi:hypothetical protein
MTSAEFLMGALEEFVSVKDIDKIVDAKKRDAVVKYELEMVAFFEDYRGWIAARDPKSGITAPAPPFLVFLSMIASLTKMSEYIITDSPLSVKLNPKLRNRDKYGVCHFCAREVSDSPNSQRIKMIYSKKTKVKTEAFHIVCRDCLRFVKALYNVRNAIKGILRCSLAGVEYAVNQLEDDKRLIESVFYTLKVQAAEFDTTNKT